MPCINSIEACPTACTLSKPSLPDVSSLPLPKPGLSYCASCEKGETRRLPLKRLTHMEPTLGRPSAMTALSLSGSSR